jgi:Tfp pilus assembly protein PilN
MPKKEINLLPREEFEKKPLGRFLTWALSAGRYIVIFTELIVILAFLSRFKLDRDLADLNQSIREKQAIIEASADFEKEFIFLQTRLAAIKKLKEQQLSFSQLVNIIGTLTPLDVAISNLSLGEEGLRINATALSEKGLGSFVANLSASPYFREVTLTSVAKSLETGPEIKFIINAQFLVSKET